MTFPFFGEAVTRELVVTVAIASLDFNRIAYDVVVAIRIKAYM